MFGAWRIFSHQTLLYWKQQYSYIPKIDFPSVYSSSVELPRHEATRVDSRVLRRMGTRLRKSNTMLALPCSYLKTRRMSPVEVYIQSHFVATPFSYLGKLQFCDASSWAWMKLHALRLGPWGAWSYTSPAWQQQQIIFMFVKICIILMFADLGGPTA